jgi:hypothetical protein
MSTPLVYLSNQPMGTLCSNVQGGTHCRVWPVDPLDPGGVVMRWTANGFPGWHFSHVEGERMIIDGHLAKVSFGGSPGLCSSVGGTPTKVIVDREARLNWYEMDACFLDSPSTDFRTEIESMLSTVRIAGS